MVQRTHLQRSRIWCILAWLLCVEVAQSFVPPMYVPSGESTQPWRLDTGNAPLMNASPASGRTRVLGSGRRAECVGGGGRGHSGLVVMRAWGETEEEKVSRKERELANAKKWAKIIMEVEAEDRASAPMSGSPLELPLQAAGIILALNVLAFAVSKLSH